jgi:hypothetical protein
VSTFIPNDAGTLVERTGFDALVNEIAAGRVIPEVHRCVLRVESPHFPEGWARSATTQGDDVDGVDGDVAFRIASA